MKKFSVLVLLFVLVLGILLLLNNSKKVEPPAIPGLPENPVPRAVATPLAASNAAATNLPPAVPENVPTDAAQQVQTKTMIHSLSPAPEPAAASLSPQMVLDNLRGVIHNYYDAFGENPVGDNAEITAALTGNNPKQANFIREDAGLRKNDRGELLDAWGTPFFFHQVSGKVMEIRSAGQDRKMWTFDDLVTR